MYHGQAVCLFPLEDAAMQVVATTLTRARGLVACSVADMPGWTSIRGPFHQAEEVMETADGIGLCVERFRCELLCRLCQNGLPPERDCLLEALIERIDGDPELAEVYSVALANRRARK